MARLCEIFGERSQRPMDFDLLGKYVSRLGKKYTVQEVIITEKGKDSTVFAEITLSKGFLWPEELRVVRPYPDEQGKYVPPPPRKIIERATVLTRSGLAQHASVPLRNPDTPGYTVETRRGERKRA